MAGNTLVSNQRSSTAFSAACYAPRARVYNRRTSQAQTTGSWLLHQRYVSFLITEGLVVSHVHCEAESAIVNSGTRSVVRSRVCLLRV